MPSPLLSISIIKHVFLPSNHHYNALNKTNNKKEGGVVLRNTWLLTGISTIALLSGCAGMNESTSLYEKAEQRSTFVHETIYITNMVSETEWIRD